MTPIEIACRATNKDGKNCGAEAGQKCNWPYPWAELMGFHTERIEDAAACSAETPETATKQELDAAVEKSGCL